MAANTIGIGEVIFQIVPNVETSVTKLVQELVPILSTAGINGVKIIHAEPRQGDVRRNLSDTSKARKLLKWQAEARIEEGLERTV